MNQTLQIISTLIQVVPLFVAIITGIVNIMKIFSGQRCLLRSEMLRIYYHNCDNETIRQYEYENFVSLYEAYKRLHGNSFVDKIYKEVQEWTVVS